MTMDVIKPLIESGLINEDIGRELNEAWVSRLNEAKEEVRAELRHEYGNKYEHDRLVMVEALDKMMTDNLKNEVKEFYEDRKSLNAERVQAQLKLKENASKFDQFMVTKLSEEIKHLRNDRKVQMENQEKIQNFIVHALAKEIKEFATDRTAMIDAKVKLVTEGQAQINELKNKFITENAQKVANAVNAHLKKEVSQLKEDIKSAREVDFGRRLFEAFASEFSVTFLNEKAETRKLVKHLKSKDSQLQESRRQLENTRKLVESKEKEVKIIKESTQRERELGKLLSTLNAEKAAVMKTLLENVQTPRLKDAFNKYLPAVLNNGSEKKAIITESTVVTGDKTAKKPMIDESDNVIDIKRLAGL